MDKIKRPVCHTEAEKRNFKETCIFPHSNQEYKRYEYPNCDIHLVERLGDMGTLT